MKTEYDGGNPLPVLWTSFPRRGQELGVKQRHPLPPSGERDRGIGGCIKNARSHHITYKSTSAKISYYKNILLLALAILCIALIPSAQTQTSPDADQIMKNVKKSLDGMSTLSCSFAWDHAWKTIDRNQHIEGTLQFKKPYRLRVEYSSKTIVVDGKTVWSYSPKNKQVEITKFQSEEKEFPTPQGIFRQYAGRKAALSGNEQVNDRETYIIKLAAPAQNGKDVTVWVDKASNFPVKTEEVSPNGDISTYILKDVKVNGKISDSVFTFTPPQGTDIVDMRE
jgi:outer membrane lipoprotein carrier protein